MKKVWMVTDESKEWIRADTLRAIVRTIDQDSSLFARRRNLRQLLNIGECRYITLKLKSRANIDWNMHCFHNKRWRLCDECNTFVPKPIKEKVYVIHPGEVRSKSDGDIHYVSYHQLCRLYRLDPQAKNVYYEKTALGLDLTNPDVEVVHLFPLESGKYEDLRTTL